VPAHGIAVVEFFQLSSITYTLEEAADYVAISVKYAKDEKGSECVILPCNSHSQAITS
jgi:hypothetical protein